VDAATAAVPPAAGACKHGRCAEQRPQYSNCQTHSSIHGCLSIACAFGVWRHVKKTFSS
jgi:hypothetical protein